MTSPPQEGGKTVLPHRFPEWASLLIPSYDGPSSMLWFTGILRIIVLLLMVGGANQMVAQLLVLSGLTITYTLALTCSLWYLLVLRFRKVVPAPLTWTQVLVDFSIVALTVGFTGGHGSAFMFLLVIVILEAGVLMGLVQGFVFASLASLFVFVIALQASRDQSVDYSQWYNLMVQTIAFFFTAFVSGYWNLRLGWIRQFQREVLDNMSSGFLLVDGRGRITGANQAGCRILGITEAAIMERAVETVLVPESGTECPVVTALRKGHDYSSYEFPARMPDGGIRLIGLTTNRLLDRSGNILMIIVSFTDLTEISRMRGELQRQDRMAIIGELAAELAHEIRNPVTSIRGSMEELRKGVDSPLLAGRLAAIAIRESDHLNEIVTGFLEFARNPELKRQNVSLTDLAHEIKNLFEGRSPEMAVSVQNGDGECVINGDPTQLRQVFLNLAQNAAEAMNFKGNLTVVVRQTGASVEVRFDDEGPGIPPDKVARIFEPFYTGKTRGVGMGLAICSRIVTIHDGTIQAAARPGGGASMIVRLPSSESV